MTVCKTAVPEEPQLAMGEAEDPEMNAEDGPHADDSRSKIHTKHSSVTRELLGPRLPAIPRHLVPRRRRTFSDSRRRRTKRPTRTPTKRPTRTPTKRPTQTPTRAPTKAPAEKRTITKCFVRQVLSGVFSKCCRGKTARSKLARWKQGALHPCPELFERYVSMFM